MIVSKRIVGRFAPSPTGPLHFGSLIAAVGSYCLARHADGDWLLRIEDIDTPRVVPGAAETIIRTLESLGFEWDGEIVYQSRRQSAYEEAVEVLREKGLIFDCACSRKEILASAPHPGEDGPVYPGTCRGGLPRDRSPRAMRIRVPEGLFCFTDGIFGRREECLQSSVGDFVLKRADGLFAYQLAVVVDDADSGVNQVVRGADLLGSTARQIYLYGCLGKEVPQYVHLPLALAADGEKISKRNEEIKGFLEYEREVFRALRFLGQKIPDEFAAASGKEALQWGVENFCLSTVPAVSQVVHSNSSEMRRGE